MFFFVFSLFGRKEIFLVKFGFRVPIDTWVYKESCDRTHQGFSPLLKESIKNRDYKSNYITSYLPTFVSVFVFLFLTLSPFLFLFSRPLSFSPLYFFLLSLFFLYLPVSFPSFFLPFFLFVKNYFNKILVKVWYKTRTRQRRTECLCASGIVEWYVKKLVR